MAEIHELRRGQEEILSTLREVLAIVRPGVAPGAAGSGPASNDLSSLFPEPGPEGGATPSGPAVRTRRRRKSVLLVDDDEVARQATQAAFTAAHVPVRAVPDGNAAIAAIAADKPDILVLELGLADPMTGRDVISMIKATMEWVDIPIVLYTRLPIGTQQEARTIHGADDFVPKGDGAAETLVARVIQIFQKG